MWVVPLLLGAIGITYTLFEHRLHLNDPAWPWLTLLGISVLGGIGPFFSWVVLRWAVNTSGAYLSAQKELALRAEQLATLNRLSLAASRSLDLDHTIASILESTMESLEAAAGMVFIQENEIPGLLLKAHQGVSVEMTTKEARLDPGHCLCGSSIARREVLFATDIGTDPRCTSDLCICEGFRSVACAPLECKGNLVGLLQLASPEVGHFSQDQRDFLSAAATQVSVAVENAQLYDAVRSFNLELEKKVNQRTRELESARWALSEKARQLQRLLSQSYQVQEDTQARIAHDMHDGVTQMIIGALYETQAARQVLAEDPERAAESLANAQRHLSEVELEIRRVIYDLHPPTLDMMGLVTALKRYASTFSSTFHIQYQINTLNQPRRLSKECEISIYRIIQAALHNVATHAQAKQVALTFDFSQEQFRAYIQDDGIGFNPDVMLKSPGDHLGLIGMKERAEGLGGSIIIQSTPGSGTHIELRLPDPQYLGADA
jgi:signal transduction histidine kinase